LSHFFFFFDFHVFRFFLFARRCRVMRSCAHDLSPFFNLFFSPPLFFCLIFDYFALLFVLDLLITIRDARAL